MPEPVSAPRIEETVSHIEHFAISSRWLYDGERRFDASTYAAGAFVALDALEACPYEKKPLGTLVGTLWHPVQNQARSNFKRIYTRKEFGVPFVGSRDMFGVPLRPDQYLSKRIPKLNDLLVPEGWLLISRSGTVGHVLYVNRHLAACAITEHAIRIEPTDVPAGYLYALLASKYGQQIIAKGAFGATVDQVEPKHIAVMPVPLPPWREGNAAVPDTIHNKILRAYALRDEVTDLIEEADRRVHEAIGLSPFTEDDIEYLSHESRAKAFAIASHVLENRFDASHYVPVARSAIDKLRSGRLPLARLGDIAKRVYIPPRFKRNYVNSAHGVPFLQGSQIPLMRPFDLKYLSRSQTRRLERWIIQKDWVLVTCSGTIGKVGMVSAAQDQWAASQHLLRIMPDEARGHPGYLAAFLMTPYGQHQLMAKIYGGVVDELTEADTEAVWVPNAPPEAQADIGSLVVSAFAKKDEANRLEDEAINAIEAIVEGRY